MARHEDEREDLFAETRALVIRGRWVKTAASSLLHNSSLENALLADELLIGLRENGWLSVYGDQSRMVQFNQAGEIRRAYREPQLYRGQGGTLARLERRRTSTETILVRHDLTADELTIWLADTQQWLTQLLHLLEAGRYQLIEWTTPLESSVESSHSTTPEDLIDRLKAIVHQPLRIAPPPIGRR
ncbi:MAG: hypothetical protein C0478_12685 [Planctomyces sp.]|nr:hypothetical protein [Planctomyces sp.]